MPYNNHHLSDLSETSAEHSSYLIAKNHFLEYLVSLFTRFIAKSITYSSLDFWGHNIYDVYLFQEHIKIAASTNKILFNKLSTIVGIKILTFLATFVKRGFKKSGSRVFLHPDFLGRHRDIFFSSLNPSIKSDLFVYNRPISILNTINHSYVAKDMLELMHIDSYLLSKPLFNISKEKVLLRKKYIGKYSIELFQNFLDHISRRYDKECLTHIYSQCTEDVFQRYCKFHTYEENEISVLEHLRILTKNNTNNNTYFLINILNIGNNRYAREYTLPLYEELIYDILYKDSSEHVDAKDKHVLPQEIREIILSFI